MMRPIPLAARCYTLLELVAVVAIIGLVMTIVAMRAGTGSKTLRLKTEADEAASFLSSAKSEALHKGARVHVTLEGRRLSIEPEGTKDETPKISRALPDDVDLLTQVREIDGRKRIFTFFPDGRGSGPTLELSSKGIKFDVSVSPLTGAISVKEAEE